MILFYSGKMEPGSSSKASPDEDSGVWLVHKTQGKQNEQMCDVGSHHSITSSQMSLDKTCWHSKIMPYNLIDILED